MVNRDSPSAHTTPRSSGAQTPREQKDACWKSEAEAPSKIEMREMYKEYGGRKVKNKGKLPSGVGGGGNRDRGGWDAVENDAW